MGLEQLEIVLCRPKTSGNIGATCRAMKTMGIHRLVIVGRRERYDENQIGYTAVHAVDLWESARFEKSLPTALADVQLAAGTTRRWGNRRNQRRFSPEQFADFVASRSDQRIAIVFGNEESGLSTEELAACNVVLSIPTSPDFPSLNLSHAVQIITYAVYSRWEQQQVSHAAISYDQADALAGSVVDSLSRLGYFRSHDPSFTRRLFRDIWLRAGVGVREYRKIDSIFERLPHIVRKRYGE